MIKRLLIVLFLYFSFAYSCSAVESIIGTLPKSPDYTIIKADRTWSIYILRNPATWTSAYGTTKIYDTSWVLLASYNDSCANTNSQVSNFAVESLNNLIFFTKCRRTDGSQWYQAFFYNYIEDSFILHGQWYASSSWISFKIIKEWQYLLLNVVWGGNTGGMGLFSYDMNALTLIEAYTRTLYTWTRTEAVMEPVLFNEYYWSKNDNQLIYLNSWLKTLEYVYIDTVGDIIRVNDVFISTWGFNSFNLIVDGDLDAHLSIYWSPIDMRSYTNYNIWSVDFISDRYFLTYIWTDIVSIFPPVDMWIDYTANTYNINMSILDLGVWDVTYWVDSLNNIIKDSDIVITYNPTINGGTGWTGWTIETGTGVLDDSIRNFDIDGDGEVWILNGEFFLAIWNIFKAFFNSIIDFFIWLKDFFAKLMELWTTESKTLWTFIINPFTISSANAYISDTIWSATLEWDNFVTNMYNFIKYFIMFILFIMVILLIVLIKRGGGNNGGSSNKQKISSNNEKK